MPAATLHHQTPPDTSRPHLNNNAEYSLNSSASPPLLDRTRATHAPRSVRSTWRAARCRALSTQWLSTRRPGHDAAAHGTPPGLAWLCAHSVPPHVASPTLV